MSFATEELAFAIPSDATQSAAVSTGNQPTIAKVLFTLPVLLSATSYIAGGIAPLTDVSFVVLTVLCLIFLLREIILFPRHQGIGAVLLYGGVLVWFCHDYLYNWFDCDFAAMPFPPSLIARAAFYHMVFIEILVLVIDIPFARWFERCVIIVPEPANQTFYLIILVAALAIGLSPFFIFTTQPFYESLYLTATLQGNLVDFTVHRSGGSFGPTMNVNYDWGGYVAQILQFGEAAGIFGVLYSLLIAKSWPGKIFGWVVWLFWCAYAFPSMRRGELAVLVLPAVGLVYYKYQVLAQTYLRRFGWKAYVGVGVLSFGLLVAVQYEGSTRNGDSLHLFRALGNTMFSEDLKDWAYFPDQNNGHYFSDSFPGEVFIRPIPETLYMFITGPIPRALWNDKPIDAFMTWNNAFVSGEHGSGVAGTTIASGAVSSWYFRYGPVGIVEGAIFFGWLLGVSQRALRRANGRPLGLLFALAFATAIFRSYRDINPHLFDPMLVAALTLYPMVRLFGTAPSNEPAPAIA